MASHKEALGRVAKNIELANQVAVDYTKAELSPRERTIADFAVKVTRVPNACSPLDIEALRAAGLADPDILALVQVAAYFNMTTRMMESLSTVNP